MSRLAPTLAFVLTGAVAPAAADDPGGWLLEVSEAARHVSYSGVVIYHDPDVMETLRVTHRFKDGREQERLTSLSGRPRDVFREDNHITCIVADEAAHTMPGTAKSLFPAMSRETLEAVAAHYEFRDLGSARVAGRACRGVAIVPRDQFRYGYHVWADTATAVPLKVSLVDRGGQVVEEFLFTEVAFPDEIPDSAFALPPGVTGFRPPPPDPQPPADSPAETWTPDRLPPGFRVTQRDRRALPDGGSVEHVLLSDGLSAVSVFRARIRLPDKMFRGLSHMGGVNAYGTMVGRFHVTVVGEVPQATVRMIGDGLQDADTTTVRPVAGGTSLEPVPEAVEESGTEAEAAGGSD